MKSVLEHLRSLSAKHRGRVDKALSIAEKIKLNAEAAKKATQEAESETE
ncbi:hypothetical protein ES707_06693 [subsurface metagenome]